MLDTPATEERNPESRPSSPEEVSEEESCLSIPLNLFLERLDSGYYDTLQKLQLDSATIDKLLEDTAQLGNNGPNSEEHNPNTEESDSDPEEFNPDPAELPDYIDSQEAEVPKLSSAAPFGRDTLGPEEYAFIEGDILNFRDKRQHLGPPLQSQIDTILKLTDSLTEAQGISDPLCANLIGKSIDNETGRLCHEIMQKFIDEGKVSAREKHFLYENRGWFYAHCTKDVSVELNSGLKAISAEVVALNGWVEVQKEPTVMDCAKCGTNHPPGADHICGGRNLNGPLDVNQPLQSRKWGAMMVGIASYVCLPWILSGNVLNYAIVDEQEYDWDTDIPYHQELDYKSTRLGRAVHERIRKLSYKEQVPIFIEFNFTKVRTAKTLLATFFNLLKVVKSLQKEYLPPIIVLMGLAVPGRNHTQNSYNNLKREHIRQSCACRVLAHLMGVPYLELIIQRRPSLTNATYEWNRGVSWNMVPLFNRYLEPTMEFHIRLAGQLIKVLGSVSKFDLPKQMKSFQGDEVDELWT